MNRIKFPDRRQRCFILTVVCAVFLVVYEWLLKDFCPDKAISGVVDMIITRAVGGLVFIVLTSYLGYRIMNPFRKPFAKSLLITLPCFIVVLCNPPILGLLTGIAHLDYSGATLAWYVFLFAIECICIALFEEFAFRGVVLMMILEKRRNSTKKIFLSIVLSAAVFGAIHLVNLVTSSPVAVLLQIGYSFLIGGMCAVILIKTANIWLCVILHAVFDFCGKLVDTYGAGAWATTPIIVFTVILGTSVCAYVFFLLFKMNPKETDRLFIADAESKQ